MKMDVSKLQIILDKIASTPDLLAKFQKAQNFEEFYDVCRKADANITRLEFEKIKQKLVDKNVSVLQLGGKKINMVTGGKMDFNKFKSLALAALVSTSMIPDMGCVAMIQSAPQVSTTQEVHTTGNQTTEIKVTETEKTKQSNLDKALLNAVLNKDKNSVEDLLDQGADINKSKYIDVNEKSIYVNSLMLAAKIGDLEMVKFLIEEKNAIINKNAGDGTALEFASGAGNLDIIKYLLSKGGTDCRGKLDSALWKAIDNDEVDAVKLLLENGADANCHEFWSNFTVLMSATRKGQIEIINLLLEHGASIFAKNHHNNKTAYDYAETDEVRVILKKAEKKAGFCSKVWNNIKHATGIDRFF